MATIIKCYLCNALKKAIFRIYAMVFARPFMQKYNDFFLQMALRGRGYNNCCTPKKTGEEKLIKLISKSNPHLCIDVGANVGDFSESLLKNTKSRVISFEPLPYAFKKPTLLKSNFPNRIILNNCGVGDKNSFLMLNYSNQNSVFASFSKEVNQIDYVKNANTKKIKVKVITLDSYFKKNKIIGNIDLLKIDTEGFEYEVLLGAKGLISQRRIKFIQLEYNWHQLFRRHTLFNLGLLLKDYDLYQLLPFGKGLVKRDIKSPETNIFHYSNFVFVRDDIKLGY
jgi:FkbM family methyltransferase